MATAGSLAVDADMVRQQLASTYYNLRRATAGVDWSVVTSPDRKVGSFFFQSFLFSG